MLHRLVPILAVLAVVLATTAPALAAAPAGRAVASMSSDFGEPHLLMRRPTPHLELRPEPASSSARERADALSADDLDRLGRRDLFLGIGIAGGGLVAVFVGAIHRAAYVPWCIWDDSDTPGCEGGYAYYDRFGYNPGGAVATIGAIVGGFAMAGGAVLIVSGLLRMQKAKRMATSQAAVWGFRWGTPVLARAPAASPGLR